MRLELIFCFRVLRGRVAYVTLGIDVIEYQSPTTGHSLPTIHPLPLCSVNCNSLSNEKEDEMELVWSLLSAERREYKNLVTPEHLLESGLLQEMAGISEEKKQQCLRARQENDKVAKVRKAEKRQAKGVESVAEGVEDRVTRNGHGIMIMG
ncbi:unnamed protein product [Prunus armeniaca]